MKEEIPEGRGWTVDSVRRELAEMGAGVNKAHGSPASIFYKETWKGHPEIFRGQVWIGTREQSNGCRMDYPIWHSGILRTPRQDAPGRSSRAARGMVVQVWRTWSMSIGRTWWRKRSSRTRPGLGVGAMHVEWV